MKIERKIYTTLLQTIGDFFLGVVLFIGILIASFNILGILMVLFGWLFGGSFLQIYVLLIFVVEIGTLIYYVRRRFWMALGMLGGFAACWLFVQFFVLPALQQYEELCRNQIGGC